MQFDGELMASALVQLFRAELSDSDFTFVSLINQTTNDQNETNIHAYLIQPGSVINLLTAALISLINSQFNSEFGFELNGINNELSRQQSVN